MYREVKRSRSLDGTKSFLRIEAAAIKRDRLSSPQLARTRRSWRSALSFKKKTLSKKQAKAESLNQYHAIDINDHNVKDDKFGNNPASPTPSEFSMSFQSACPADSVFSPQGKVSPRALEYVAYGNILNRTQSKNWRSRKVSGLWSVNATSYSAEDSLRSKSAASFSTQSSFKSRFKSVKLYTKLSRSFSFSANTFDRTSSTSGRRRASNFSKRLPGRSSSSMKPAQPVANEVKVPSPDRFSVMYNAVYKGVSELISVNTAELNVLQVRKNEASTLSAAQVYDSDKIVRHLERVIRKLQFHQSQLDEIHEAYTLQQRYRDGAYKLKSAISSSRVSRRAAMLMLKTDIYRWTETLCTLEQEFTGLLGRLHIEMNGLLGFARLRSGDQYEVVIRYGLQKWRIKGSVKSSVDQTWDVTHKTMQPLLTDLLNIKVMEVKMLGKHSTIGNVVLETKNFFKVEPQDLIVDLNDTATLKLSLKVKWSPYDGYESPHNLDTGKFFTTTGTRLRSRSARERPISAHFAPRTRIQSAFTRPVSVAYSATVNVNNSNNKGTLRISAPILSGSQTTSSISTEKFNKENTCNDSQVTNVSIATSIQGEEDAFLAAISRNAELAETLVNAEDVHELVKEKTATKRKNTFHEMTVSQNLISVASGVNLQMDDYRGRHKELRHLENTLIDLLDKLKVEESDFILTDGFNVLSFEESEDSISRQILENYEEGKIPTSGNIICDEALIPHLKLIQCLLKDVGVYGPLKVKEILALDKLQKQGKIIARIIEIADSEEDLLFDDMPEFDRRRTLLEMWRSCCDGNTLLCVSAKTLKLELMSAFGRDVRIKHKDVADKVFPELVKRIVARPDIFDIERESVTLFHLSRYVDDAADGESEDFEKLVDKLALEMFITSTLSSGIPHLVLVAIKRVSSLLALRISNLQALSHLLLDSDHDIRTAAAAHIRHIATETILREKAILAYTELLESKAKRDRQCACIAIGFLSAAECIPQLSYIFHSDVEQDVRVASSNVLKSLGEDGEEALDHVSSTLLSQTMTQRITLSNHARMGTAL